MKRYGPELYIGDVSSLAKTSDEPAPKPKKEKTTFGEMIPYGNQKKIPILK
jgi:hypothetical protein